MRTKIHSVLTAGILLAACSTSALALTLPVSEDSSTSSNANVAGAAGKATTLPVTSTRQALVRFEAGAFADSIAAGEVSKARLIVFISSVTSPGALTLHRVTQDWSENIGSIPSYDPRPLATIPQSSVVAKQFVIIDVTPAVQAWLRAPGTDFGFAFVASGGARVLLGAKEGPATGHPAQLQIEAPEVGPITIGDEGEAAFALESPVAITGRTRAAAVLNTDILNNSIEGKKLKNGTLRGFKLFAQTITNRELGLNSVTSANITDGTITNADLSAGFTLPPPANGSITAAKLDPAIGLWTASGANVSRASGRVIVAGDSAIDTANFTGLSLQYFSDAGEGAIMSSYDDGHGFLTFYTKADGSPITQRMIIGTDGNVGIGTTAPAGRLNINETVGTQNNPDSGTLVLDHEDSGGASSIVFRSAVNRGSDYGFIQYQDDATIGGGGEAAVLTIGTSNDSDDHIALMPAGNVGVGTTTPGSKLTVNGEIETLSGVKFPNGTVQTTAAPGTGGTSQFLKIGPGAFVADDTTNRVVNSFFEGVWATGGELMASVQLPVGAQVLSVKAYVNDAVAGTNLNVRLSRKVNSNTSTNTDVNFEVLAGSSGFFDQTFTGGPIINADQAYLLRISAVNGPWPGNGTLAVQNIVIEWRMP